MSHTRDVCEHGMTVSQCRCPHPSKPIGRIVRPCPFGEEHLGLTVVHPLPPAEAVGEGLGQVPRDPAEPGQEPLDELGASEDTQQPLALYLEAITRYARDEEFHARVKRVELELIKSEPDLMPGAQSGARLGAALALHLAERGLV